LVRKILDRLIDTDATKRQIDR